ncbi:MAG: hypothetical protein L0271_07925 [Gemmatimonadetes bacterium]|nr:hypothetical protein [Gemmatimonadota bacterium]
MRRESMVTAVLALLVAGCSYHQPPVPLLGSDSDIAALAGEWYGTHWSVESGRSGSILFRLTAGADSALGDVLMVPREATGHEMRSSPAEFIPIRFVGIDQDRVRGMLATYRDPVCGCRLETVFFGELKADTIVGTFESRHLEGGSIQKGNWRVVRQSSANRDARSDR